MDIARDRRLSLLPLVGLVALAWMALGVWGRSPYARYLSHESLDRAQIGRYVSLLLLFVLGWTLMTVAMMLPTTLPLIALFRRMTARRENASALTILLIAGYLAAWGLFGVVAHAADLGLHRLFESVTFLERNPWMVGAGTLLTAGAYQFSSLKYRCLDQCRSPLSFIAGHWSGRDERRESFALGIHHGVFCVGCCWSLMLLMFAVGVGNVGWMLLLAAVMATEKNLPWGRRLSAPLGIVLLACGVSVTVFALA